MTRPGSARRGRGRPPATATDDTRAAILAAARVQFAKSGLGGASVRAIARAAGVDPSLVSHYFGDKRGLFVACLELPVDPVAKLTEVVAGGCAGMGERLVRTFVTSWDPHREVFAAVVRSSLGADDGLPVADLARDVLANVVTDALDGPDRRLRAGLVAAQVVGIGVVRYVVALEPVASASADDVVRRYAPAVQAVIDGGSHPADFDG